jgi:hypothetical protein
MLRAVPDVKTVTGNEVVIEFLLVFDDFDAEEDGSQGERSDQEKADEFLFANLRGPDGHGHCQAAQDEHNGVAATECDVERIAADTESGAIGVAVNGVSQEQAAEEQDFGDQEDPHAERSSFLLLLERLKMSVQFSGAMHSALLFSF